MYIVADTGFFLEGGGEAQNSTRPKTNLGFASRETFSGPNPWPPLKKKRWGGQGQMLKNKLNTFKVIFMYFKRVFMLFFI